jgi:hypothetical protein
MNKKNKEDKIQSFLEGLTESFGRSEGESLEEVINSLKEDGFNVEASVSRLKAKVQNFSQETKRRQLVVAREKRLSLENEAASKVKDFIGLSKDIIINKIMGLCIIPNISASVSYRDLEAKSETDLIALLEDLELAKKIEEEKA